MGPRPTNLNLRDDSGQNNEAFERPRMPFMSDLPSPRAGEIPPAMSPLDQFAWQSRMMAKKFQEEQEKGRRVSRLDPQLVEKEIRGRPGFFRSHSDQSRMSHLAELEEEEATSPQPQSATLPVQTQEGQRPVSHYPLFDRASMLTEDGTPGVSTPFYDAQEGARPEGEPHAGTSRELEDYFGIPRATSPEAVEPNVNVQAPSPNVPPSLTNSIDTISSHPRTRTNDSQRSQRSQKSQVSERGYGGLAPPQSPRFPKNARSLQSIRSVPPDSGDEDGASTNGSQSQGLQSSRKFSGSSGVLRPQSPFSPWMQPVHRSPSMTSEYSINGTQQFQGSHQPFSHNFSRPMSSQGRTSLEARTSFDSRPSMDRRPEPPRRQASGASSSTEASFKPAVSRGNSGDDVRITTLQTQMHYTKMDIANMPTTPNISAPPGDGFRAGAITPSGASNPSYIYAKYSLPRGRPVDRDSTAFRDSWIQKQFEWDREHGHSRQSSAQPFAHARNMSDGPMFDASTSPALSEPRAGRKLAVESSASRSKSADPRAADKAKTPLSSMHKSSPSVKTTSTDQTIKPSPLHKKSTSAELSPEEHLEVGIEAHDQGATNKSTYHLRLAAMAGLPTAMLLYALACRHGWGMRPNQAEGVKWLRKAIDTAGLDVADAEERLNTGPGKAKLDPMERKKRKAQYALAIYELGISSMNGWGCPKDKPLAVRCYEIAGSWGDADATAEAAFCYTQGVGVKKDLHKAAALYRKAADMGMSMAGNSWIYKAKYMPDPAVESPEKKRPETATSKDGKRDSEKTGQPRARSRSIWGKRKSEKPPAMPA